VVSIAVVASRRVIAASAVSVLGGAIFPCLGFSAASKWGAREKEGTSGQVINVFRGGSFANKWQVKRCQT
jgi:hypothetical protein